MTPIDMVGFRSGRLVAVELVSVNPRKWLCRCDCGQTKVIRGKLLRNGDSQSCGCWHHEWNIADKTTHGKTGTREFRIWCGIRKRCSNPRAENYGRYGGRGITVDPAWDDFAVFLRDMGECPTGYTIHRDNNDGPYSADNCRWATDEEQANNKRNSRRLMLNGETLTLAQWSRRIGITRETLRSRLDTGWSVERALTEPVRS